MTVNVSDALKNEGDIFDFKSDIIIPEIDIYGETHCIKDAIIEGTYTYTGNEIVVVAHITANILGKCGVCLKEVLEHLSYDFSSTFVKLSDKNNFDNNDDRLYYYNEDVIDLNEPILESFIIHLPLKYKCKDNCSNFFENNISNKTNPFSVLQDLLNNDEEV